jgi:hypothetical protein
VLRPQFEAAGFEVLERAPAAGPYAQLLVATREDGDVEVIAYVVAFRDRREYSIDVGSDVR